MNQTLQKQIYNQTGVTDYMPNGDVWRPAAKSEPSQSYLHEMVRGQRRPQETWPTIPVKERHAPKLISSRLAEAIQISRSILDLKNDWDEEGSKGYEADTWNRAINWLKESALALREQQGVWVEPPRILPGPEGSIDIHWKTAKRELLINIPEKLQEPADYYGCGAPNDTLKGKLNTSFSNEWILVWLMK